MACIIGGGQAEAGHKLSRMRPLAVFDIDGVLADARHRQRHLEHRPKRWDAFFAEVADDPPLPTGVALAQEAAGDCEVVYLTGRPERCRADTAGWLQRHHLPPGRLVMRRERDRRPARTAKLELLTELAVGRTVAIVVDDDEAVCRAGREAGWAVLLADWAVDAAPSG